MATTLAQLPIADNRGKLKRASWSIGQRPATRYFTIHYNGPPVKAFGNPIGEFAQLQFDAGWHMRPGALGATNGGDGIQYHGATLSNGRNVLLRDWGALLWHCGNSEGNKYSIAWHIPIGGAQAPKLVQSRALFEVVIPTVCSAYKIPLKNVRLHKEWKVTDCPGTPLSLLLRHYRLQWGIK